MAHSVRTTGVLKNRYLKSGPHRFNLKLDDYSWEAFREIGKREGIALAEICLLLAAKKPDSAGLTMAVRSNILRYFRGGATEARIALLGEARSLMPGKGPPRAEGARRSR